MLMARRNLVVARKEIRDIRLFIEVNDVAFKVSSN